MCIIYTQTYIYILAASLICTVSETLKVLKILMYQSFTHSLFDYSLPNLNQFLNDLICWYKKSKYLTS